MERFGNGPSKRKKGAGKLKDSPFPVPIASVPTSFPCHGKLMHYTGILDRDRVIVHCSGDMAFIYRMGFFGKGSLSRGQPDFQQRQTMAHIPETAGSPAARLRIMKKRQYLRHKRWQKRHAGAAGRGSNSGWSSDSSLSEEECEEDEEPFLAENPNKILDGKISVSNTECDIATSNWENNSRERTDLADTPRVGRTQNPDATWVTSSALWEQGNLKTDGKQDRENKTQESQLDVWEEDDNFWHDEDHDENIGSQMNEKVSSPGKCKDDVENSDSQKSNGLFVSKVDESEMECTSEKNENIPTVESNNLDGTNFSPSLNASGCSLSDGDAIKKNEKEIFNKDLKVQSLLGHSDSHNSENVAREATQTESREAIHPDCTEETDGGLLVIDDSGDEVHRGRKRKKQRHFWPAVRKREPYPISETLCLTLEEAFFLSYGLGCLTILENNKEQSLCEMWSSFIQRDPRFVHRYIAYHFLRSKGWVPKSGLKFGVDFLLYREGPPFFHGSFSVVVNTVREQVGAAGQAGQHDRWTSSWTKLAGLNRITEQVGKVLMFCHVIVPANLSETDKESPACIPKYKVQLQVMQRWVSSQERDKELETEVL